MGNNFAVVSRAGGWIASIKEQVLTAYLARILVFPIKSFEALDVGRARVLPSGALENDRRWALVDTDEKFVNGKRTPLLNQLRSQFELSGRRLAIEVAGQRHVFQVDDDRLALQAWLTAYFSTAVTLVENAEVGFPDDLDAPGPTIISTATLETVAGWFPGMSMDEARRRFRANLEIGGVEPFWEDRLYARKEESVLFRVGEVTFAGSNPCQRCVVPSRDSRNGDVWPEFSKTLARRREASLPAWAERTRFNHFYRLAVNTRPHGAGGEVCTGDAVSLAGL
jgi:hypothetical protein